MTIYFSNLTFRLHVFYVLNMHVKFQANQMLFTIRFVTYFSCTILDYKNLKFKYLINDITINF